MCVYACIVCVSFHVVCVLNGVCVCVCVCACLSGGAEERGARSGDEERGMVNGQRTVFRWSVSDQRPLSQGYVSRVSTPHTLS